MYTTLSLYVMMYFSRWGKVIAPHMPKLRFPEAIYARVMRSEKTDAISEATIVYDALSLIAPLRYVAAIVPNTKALIGELPPILGNPGNVIPVDARISSRARMKKYPARIKLHITRLPPPRRIMR